MCLQYILEKEKDKGFTVDDIRNFYEKEVMPIEKPNRIKRKISERIKSEFNKDTPNKILTRLKQSHWVTVEHKENRFKGRRGRIPNIHVFGEKARNYLKDYGSFLTGPICRKPKKIKEEEKVEEKKGVPAITVKKIKFLERE
jgi:hypothetical protein